MKENKNMKVIRHSSCNGNCALYNVYETRRYVHKEYSRPYVEQKSTLLANNFCTYEAALNYCVKHYLTYMTKQFMIVGRKTRRRNAPREYIRGNYSYPVGETVRTRHLYYIDVAEVQTYHVNGTKYKRLSDWRRKLACWAADRREAWINAGIYLMERDKTLDPDDFKITRCYKVR